MDWRENSNCKISISKAGKKSLEHIIFKSFQEKANPKALFQGIYTEKRRTWSISFKKWLLILKHFIKIIRLSIFSEVLI